MKRIDAIVRPQLLEIVRDKLCDAGVDGLTVTEVIGFGRQRGHKEFYRGCEYNADFQRKYLLRVILRDEQVDEVIEAIVQGARTGKMGDGKIFVSSLDEVVRIRTGEIGVAAS